MFKCCFILNLWTAKLKWYCQQVKLYWCGIVMSYCMETGPLTHQICANYHVTFYMNPILISPHSHRFPLDSNTHPHTRGNLEWPIGLPTFTSFEMLTLFLYIAQLSTSNIFYSYWHSNNNPLKHSTFRLYFFITIIFLHCPIKGFENNCLFMDSNNYPNGLLKMCFVGQKENKIALKRHGLKCLLAQCRF